MNFRSHRKRLRWEFWNMKVNIIYLAAGNSRRFCIEKEKKENKLLYPFHGRPLYEYGLEALRTAARKWRESKIYVVTQYEEIYEAVSAYEEVTAVFSQESKKGLSYTIRKGLLAAGKEEAWYLFMTADQPFVSAETILGLIKGVEISQKNMGTILYEGVPATPTIFAGSYYEELMALEGDKGGRKVLMAHPEEVYGYQVQDRKELKDFDHWEEVIEEEKR